MKSLHALGSKAQLEGNCLSSWQVFFPASSLLDFILAVFFANACTHFNQPQNTPTDKISRCQRQKCRRQWIIWIEHQRQELTHSKSSFTRLPLTCRITKALFWKLKPTKVDPSHNCAALHQKRTKEIEKHHISPQRDIYPLPCSISTGCCENLACPALLSPKVHGAQDLILLISFSAMASNDGTFCRQL